MVMMIANFHSFPVLNHLVLLSLNKSITSALQQ